MGSEEELDSGSWEFGKQNVMSEQCGAQREVRGGVRQNKISKG